MGDHLLPGLHQVAPGSPTTDAPQVALEAMLPEVVSGPERYEYLSFLILARDALRKELDSARLKRPTDPWETYMREYRMWEESQQPQYRSLGASDGSGWRSLSAAAPEPPPRQPLPGERDKYHEEFQAWRFLYQRLNQNLKLVESRLSTNMSPRYVAAMKELLK